MSGLDPKLSVEERLQKRTPEWLFICEDVDTQEAADTRARVKYDHFDRVEDGYRLRIGGALLKQAPKRGEALQPLKYASLIVIETDTEEEAWEMIKTDVYCKTGVWDLNKTKIYPFLTGVQKGRVDHTVKDF